MDKRQTLEYNEALNLVRRYKQVIASRFQTEPRVMMYGSYEAFLAEAFGLSTDLIGTQTGTLPGTGTVTQTSRSNIS